MGYLVLGIVLLSLVIAIPLVFIWAVNTLFGLTIAYTFINWFASLLIMIILRADRVSQ